MSEFLGYSQNGKIDKSKGFIHKTVFQGREESFVINGYDITYLTKEEVDIINISKTLEQEKDIKIAQCSNYLNETDWYIVRMSDPSNASVVPENILINRANARTWQKDINACKTLEELNNININFS